MTDQAFPGSPTFPGSPGSPSDSATSAGPITPFPPAPRPTDDSAPPEGGDDASESNKSGLPISVIIGIVLVSAALLVLVALSVPLLLQQLRADPAPPYAVGDCVVQDGSRAVPADCEESGAYRVVLEVERFEDCPDYPDLPAITVSDPAAVFCVRPVEDTEDVG